MKLNHIQIFFTLLIFTCLLHVECVVSFVGRLFNTCTLLIFSKHNDQDHFIPSTFLLLTTLRNYTYYGVVLMQVYKYSPKKKSFLGPSHCHFHLPSFSLLYIVSLITFILYSLKTILFITYSHCTN